MDVCRELSCWLCTRGECQQCSPSQLLFRRRSTSIMPLEGHWEGRGDILHRPDVKFPFAVECKKREGWQLDDVFSIRGAPLQWWSQAERQARESHLHPLLVFTRNRRPVYVMLEEGSATCLKLHPREGAVAVVPPPVGEQRPRLVLALLDDLTATAPGRQRLLKPR